MSACQHLSYGMSFWSIGDLAAYEALTRNNNIFPIMCPVGACWWNWRAMMLDTDLQFIYCHSTKSSIRIKATFGSILPHERLGVAILARQDDDDGKIGWETEIVSRMESFGNWLYITLVATPIWIACDKRTQISSLPIRDLNGRCLRYYFSFFSSIISTCISCQTSKVSNPPEGKRKKRKKKNWAHKEFFVEAEVVLQVTYINLRDKPPNVFNFLAFLFAAHRK